VVADVADRVLVMYAGKVVEDGPKLELFDNAQHPYTWGLMGSIPRLDRPKPDRLTTIPGRPPSLLDLPPGCAFRERCARAEPDCLQSPPMLAMSPTGHAARCLHPL